ncbi:putative response regulatory protein [Paenibacillus konkukensis]|uniref:Response regulatory protein n=1 Tax=Paenibacillus konkukensis TaxID=2020716 RepID=A0ABY4RU11_9BACL|nr:response regulator [Paenibacillus konkukensis]UQZ86086.1 putative response regulatory protein [Paenibacillus konkukensis]
MYKILAADDEEDTRDTLCNCFPWESVGFTVVHQAGNGLEALSYLEANPVDVLLCDIRMPMMSGLELCKQIHQRRMGVRIVLLSAYRDFEYAREAMTYGVSHYMLKPAKYDDIVGVFTQLKTALDEAKDSLAAEAAEHGGALPGSGWGDPVISTIVKCVNTDYRTVTLQLVSETVEMNSSYVSVYFKKKTGMHFSEYVLKVRMEKAAELLKHGYMKAFEVSEAVGYANPKNFIRAFKQFHGITPGQFKNGR